MPWEDEVRRRAKTRERVCFSNGLMLGVVGSLIGVGFAIGLSDPPEHCPAPPPEVNHMLEDRT